METWANKKTWKDMTGDNNREITCMSQKRFDAEKIGVKGSIQLTPTQSNEAQFVIVKYTSDLSAHLV